MSLCFALAILSGRVGNVQAQQLEPRAYSPAPVGTNFIGLGYQYSYGGASFDPSLPITNVYARVSSLFPFYGRTFDLLGRQASVTVTTPYAWGTIHGDVGTVGMSVDRSGFADPLVRFAVNLIGGQALTPQEFFQWEQGTIVGASLTISAPFGQYDTSKLINIGTNRWEFKPELGFSQSFGNWIFEFDAGVWLFTDNDNYYGGTVRRQDPLLSLQTHIIYNILTHLWVAADFTYYAGGLTTVNGVSSNDRQANTRGGFTLSVPVTQQQSFKFFWSNGVSTRIGTSFQTMGAVWQLVWF